MGNLWFLEVMSVDGNENVWFTCYFGCCLFVGGYVSSLVM